MKTKAAAGIIVILLGVLTVLIPQFIFPVCTGRIELLNGKALYMRCHYTAAAELIIGTLTVYDGILIILFKNQETRIALSIILFFLGLSVVLIPTAVIGMCEAASMDCRVGTEPALIVISVAIMLFAAGSVLSHISSARSKQLKERSMVE